MSTARDLFMLVLGDAQLAQRAGQRLSDRGAWNEALGLSMAWKIVPRLARILRQYKLSVPTDVQARLRQQLTMTALQSGYVAQRAAGVFEALAAANVSAVGFKGVATLARLHHSPADRMLGDIDIIIQEDAFEPALEALASIGFRPTFGESVEDWRNFSSQRIRQDNHTIALADDEGLEVDLHYRLDGRIALKTAELLNRADELALCGRSVRVVSPEDAILLLAHHSLRTHFSPFPTVRDLVDLAEYWHTGKLHLDVGQLGADAARCDLGQALSAMLAMLVSCGGISGTDQRLMALTDALAQPEAGNTQRIVDWFLFRLDTPGAGGQALLDLSLLLRTPAHLGRWFFDRFKAGQEVRSAPWHVELERHRVLRGKSDFGRVLEMMACLGRIGWRRLPLWWSVMRLQRLALHPAVPPSGAEGRDAG